MSATRRETLVTILNGGTPSLERVNATFAVPGTQEFLNLAQSRGLSNSDVVDRLVAFKAAGGSGLANAIASITAEFNAPAEPECDDTLQDILEQLDDLRSQVAAALA